LSREEKLQAGIGEEEGCHGLAALLGTAAWLLMGAGLGLQSQLAVGWLASALAMGCPFLCSKFFGGHGTDLIDVATAEARTVRTVPVLFHDHGATTTGTNSGRSGLHRYFEPPSVGRVAQRFVPAWPSRASSGTKKAFCQ
jgi:hypothetical protein